MKFLIPPLVLVSTLVSLLATIWVSPARAAPHNQACLLVLTDKSMSMRVEKRLKKTSNALVALVDRMPDELFAAFLAFDTNPLLLSPFAPIEQSRSQVKKRLKLLFPSMKSNLENGLAEALRLFKNRDCVRHLQVISDSKIFLSSIELAESVKNTTDSFSYFSFETISDPVKAKLQEFGAQRVVEFSATSNIEESLLEDVERFFRESNSKLLAKSRLSVASENESSKGLITLSLKEVSLDQLVYEVARQAEKNMLVSFESESKVSLTLEDSSFDSAIEKICKSFGLSRVVDKDIVRLYREGAAPRPLLRNESSAFKGRLVTLDLEHSSLEKLIDIIEEIAGYQFERDSAISKNLKAKPLSLYLRNIPWDLALSVVLERYELEFNPAAIRKKGADAINPSR